LRNARSYRLVTALLPIKTELTKWAEKWQMTFHPAKCYILRVTRKKIPIFTNYEMLGQQLETVHQYPYLGVEM
jgi:hypothetical protein